MTFARHQFEKMRQAIERDEGIKPDGSAQAAMLDFCSALAERMDLIEKSVVALEEKLPDSAPATLVRIERKLDAIVKDGDRSLFERVFGKPA